MIGQEPFVAVGAVLARAGNLDSATRAMTAYIIEPTDANRAALIAAGLNADQARDFRALLPADPGEQRRACDLGRAWALGRSSVRVPPTWQPVVTAGDVRADRVDRLTAETMIGLVVGARKTLRVFSPFIDARGIDVLALSIAGATRRGVLVTVGYARSGNRDGAVEHLSAQVQQVGNSARLTLGPIEGDRPFPHLKVILTDSTRGYLGSANLTWPALTSNAEVGALVEGEPVVVLEKWFDALLERPPDPQSGRSVSGGAK